jgi:hypothetical protein
MGGLDLQKVIGCIRVSEMKPEMKKFIFSAFPILI